jgi:hypothetical protein
MCPRTSPGTAPPARPPAVSPGTLELRETKGNQSFTQL